MGEARRQGPGRTVSCMWGVRSRHVRRDGKSIGVGLRLRKGGMGWWGTASGHGGLEKLSGPDCGDGCTTLTVPGAVGPYTSVSALHGL